MNMDDLKYADGLNREDVLELVNDSLEDIKGGITYEDVTASHEQEVERAKASKVKNDHRRSETTRNHMAWGTRAVIWLIVFVVISITFTVAWHHVLGNHFSWLSPDQLEQLRNFLLSGAVVSIVLHYFRKLED